jgi:PTS system mannose-specific IIA component
MVGLIVASHGHLADEMVHTAEQIVGKLSSVETCSIEPGASPEQIRNSLKDAVEKVDSGDGVIVLADLFGGTPCNQSLALCRQCRIEVVTGVNLPMLIKADSLRADRNLRLPELAQALTTYGQKNITCPTAMLREAEAARPH